MTTPSKALRAPYLLTLNRHRGLAIALLVLGVVAISIINTLGAWDFRWAWVVTLGILTAGVMVIGGAVNGRFEGVLIDNRNRVSLSKFQATLWTLLLASALISAAALNLENGHTPALEITLPVELLLAMGISAGTYVATPTLLSLKAGQTDASAEALEATSEKLNLPPGQTSASGQVFSMNHSAYASWTDMFRGDEVNNAASADLSKVQQFIITLLLIGVYCADLWRAFGATAFAEMPALSPGFVILMGISHASYLAYKAAPHGGKANDDGHADPRTEAVG
jgi:hypothetical protein